MWPLAIWAPGTSGKGAKGFQTQRQREGTACLPLAHPAPIHASAVYTIKCLPRARHQGGSDK